MPEWGRHGLGIRAKPPVSYWPAALLFDRGPRYSLTTASASAQAPIHSANTAIVPKATRPMPVIASLIDSLHSRDVPDSLHRIY